MEIGLPKSPCRIEEISRSAWIAFKWEAVYVFGSTEPLMFCVGEESPEGAEQRAVDWDVLHRARTDLIGKKEN